MIFLWYHHYMRNNEETKQNQMISIAEDGSEGSNRCQHALYELGDFCVAGKVRRESGGRVRYGRCDIVLFPGLRDFHGTRWDIGDDARLYAPFAPLHVPAL